MSDDKPPEINSPLENELNAYAYATQQNPSAVTLEMEPKDEQALSNAVAAYNKLCLQKDGTYKEGYEKPEVDDDGRTKFTFPTEKEAVGFFLDRAKQGEQFKLAKAGDPNKIIAFSNGDGFLRRPPEPDGAIIKEGELFDTPPTEASLSI